MSRKQEQTILKELSLLRKALEFYANKNNDLGETARKALQTTILNRSENED